MVKLDPLTQQYYLRVRFYNPAIARFTQEDEYHGDGLNLYAYCANDPVDYYDPSGYYKNQLAERRYVVNGESLTEKEFQKLRRKAVRDAWKEEKKLVENGRETRKWTEAELSELKSKGRVKGYEGQHMKSAKEHPDYAGSSKNIQFLKGRKADVNEHLAAHGGDYRNPTNGYYNPETGKMIDFGNNEPWKEIFEIK